MAASTCQGPLVLCPGKKSGCRPWWPQPGSGARRLSPVTWQPGPITAPAALNSRGCWTQGAYPGSAGWRPDADDTGLLRLLAWGVPSANGAVGEVIQVACQGVHGIGGQYRGHQQVAVLGEGAPLLAGELGPPGHGRSITRLMAAIHLVFRREPPAATGQATAGTAPPPFRQVSVITAAAASMRHRAGTSPARVCAIVPIVPLRDSRIGSDRRAGLPERTIT